MKLARLESTTQHPSPESAERGQRLADERIRRVEAGEGVAPDRERSLQQEVAEMEPEALAGFAGGELILQQAKALAVELTHADAPLAHLIRPDALPGVPLSIDDEA